MKRPREYFRAGVGAVITDGVGRVLSLERADVPGAWQFPQGGLESGEEPLAAALREVREEAGIPAPALELLQRFPEPLAYELPPEARSAKTGRGQVLYWFLFRLREPSAAIPLPEPGEFRAWRWSSPEEVADGVVGFRRAMYRRLVREFGLLGGRRDGTPTDPAR